MKPILPIKIKAILFTIIFLTNTVVGFACSIGMIMSKSHHDKEIVIGYAKHSHPLGNKPHSHKHSKANNSIPDRKNKDTKDNCCKDEVAKFVNLDKQIVKNTFATTPLILILVSMPAYQFDIYRYGIHTPNNSFFVRCHHPPITDIRIAVQSFQI